ncbi:MAG: TetR family transcriptional regulator [Telluria sp.]
MARKSNSEQRRQEIVQAMLAVMSSHGYEKATIQLIAQQAGLAPGLVHYHFKNKEEILLHLVGSLAQLAQARYAKCAAGAVTAQDKLKAYIDARLAKGAGASPDAVAAWVVIGAEAVRQPAVRALYQHAVTAELRLVQDLLKGCLAERGKRVRRVAALAASLVAFMEGAFQLATAAQDVLPDGFAAGTALQLMQRYIDAEPDK